MEHLPENVQTLLQHPMVTYAYTSTQESFLTRVVALRSEYIQPYLIEPLSAFLTNSTAMPDLLSIALLVIIFYISLRVLDYARRVIMFWVMLAFRLVFWGSVLGFAWYVYRVGIDTAGRDVGWLFGVISGFIQDFQQRAVTASNASSHDGKSGFSWGR
ncbi:Nuclear pore assembly and biogenesis protein APQ12 [Penicillium capsulatum]|uniref:Nuclear pore assembly and biogenesis protein APQ12 n=1 Tax=Penicillium capsulatum TaxID=69766 RepID=A0A9W9HNE6_9EURO|nr:Nuclear pore assembly and biogenesis protein APQ12 [Penicillium capsulatum]KAJ6112873.1 Nuclear pore assembly and biogenesis protein [Penicillium capsulatum]